MIQLQILSGKSAGTRWVARRFPVRIGREAGSDLQLEEDGVWNRHCELQFVPAEGFMLVAQPDALLTVNHQPVQTARLRNGDALELGSVRLRFWLADPPRRNLGVREVLVWTLIAGLTLGQLALIAWQLP
ncbi:MAG: FHA domain-containing protein [Pedosphaera sp.]|nr:FHA domain-containing protein [Pedosphaera sp.]